MEAIGRILTPGRIKVPLAAATKRDAIAELIGLLADGNDVSDPRAALEAVLAREQFRPTCMGGLALPHGKTDTVKTCLLALGKPATAIDFGSSDGLGVSLVALILSPPSDASTPIRLLAELTGLIAEPATRDKLYSASSAEELYRVITSRPSRRHTRERTRKGDPRQDS